MRHQLEESSEFLNELVDLCRKHRVDFFSDYQGAYFIPGTLDDEGEKLLRDYFDY